MDNRPCCAVVLAHQVDEEKWTKVPQAIGHPDRNDKGNDETFLCDQGNRIAEGPDDCGESVDCEEENMVEGAAEEKVGKAPQRVEHCVVNQAVLHDVHVVDGDHHRQTDAAVEQVNDAKTLDADVCHCLQGRLTPDCEYSLCGKNNFLNEK